MLLRIQLLAVEALSVSSVPCDASFSSNHTVAFDVTCRMNFALSYHPKSLKRPGSAPLDTLATSEAFYTCIRCSVATCFWFAWKIRRRIFLMAPSVVFSLSTVVSLSKSTHAAISRRFTWVARQCTNWFAGSLVGPKGDVANGRLAIRLHGGYRLRKSELHPQRAP